MGDYAVIRFASIRVMKKGSEFPHKGKKPYRRHPGEACPVSVRSGGRGFSVFCSKINIVGKKRGIRLPPE